jgi:hypothetical protein
MPPVVDEGEVDDSFDAPGDQDVAWIQDKATRPKDE